MYHSNFVPYDPVADSFHRGVIRSEDPGDSPHQDPARCQVRCGTGATKSVPEQWLVLHGDALYRYALFMTSDRHRAEDLVQETLLAALQARDVFVEEANERTWLTAILRHKIIDQRRRDQVREKFLTDNDPVVEGNFGPRGKWRVPPKKWSSDPHRAMESQEFWAIFEGCLGAVPEPIRESFVLRVLQNHTAEEVCGILGITDSNLWTLLFRARERLRRCLEFKWFSRKDG